MPGLPRETPDLCATTCNAGCLPPPFVGEGRGGGAPVGGGAPFTFEASLGLTPPPSLSLPHAGGGKLWLRPLVHASEGRA